MKKIGYALSFIILGILLSLFTQKVIFQCKPKDSVIDLNNKITDDKKKETFQIHKYSEEELPSLPIESSYFSNNGYVYGSIGKDQQFPEEVTIEGEADTRTPPTQDISLKDSSYTNELQDLPTVQSDNVIFQSVKDVGIIFEDVKRKNIQEYGDMARRFIMTDEKEIDCTAGNEFIDKITKVDVDNDGKKEDIIELSTLGANPWETRSLIVKNNKIIFEVKCPSIFPEINPANGNGFYLQWGDNFKKRIGYMVTRFVYKDNKFIPLFEQQVRFLKVGNID